MNDTVPNDHDDRTTTTVHTVEFWIDPEMGPRLVARPSGLLLSLDGRPVPRRPGRAGASAHRTPDRP